MEHLRRTEYRRASLCLLGAILGIPHASLAVDPIVVLRPSGIPKDYGADFGTGVALSEEWLVIGAPADFSAGEAESGSAYVYRREGVNWIEHQKLFGEGWTNERFGSTIALDGDWLMISAPNLSNFCCPTGRVYAFRRNTNGTKNDLSDDSWELFQIVNENRELCCLGPPIALDGEVLVVGAPRPEFDPDTDSGQVYVFELDRNSWVHTQTIRPSDPRPHDGFGGAVAKRGLAMVIGAPNVGAVYVFHRTRDGWDEGSKLTSSDGPGHFGSSVAITESAIAVGAPWTNGQRLEEGTAFVFKYEGDSPVEKCKLKAWASDGQYPNFGANVALHDDLILVAAYDQPWVYSFRFDGDSCVPLNALHGTQGIVHSMGVATDARFVVARNHVYAVGPVLDLANFALFQNCVGAGRREVMGACSQFDLESDRRIDAQDLPLYLLTFRGPE